MLQFSLAVILVCLDQQTYCLRRHRIFVCVLVICTSIVIRLKLLLEILKISYQQAYYKHY